MPLMLSEDRLRQLLEPFALELSPAQASKILAYIELLMRWNLKINLTAIRDPEHCVTRHFGETLMIAPHLKPGGRLLDIGSGAGFPGLALKIACPALPVTLLEPVAKKRAFLKEASRVCGFHDVDVRGDRIEAFAATIPPPAFDFVTTRAVGGLSTLVPHAAACLKPEGKLLLWLTAGQAAELKSFDSPLAWEQPLQIPLSRSTAVWIGVKHPHPTDCTPADKRHKML